MVTMGFAPSFLARTAAATGSRQKLLIAIFQRGAVDGLNMVVPFGEADYYRARPSIAIAKPGATDGAIDLNGFFGLHPRMSPFKPLWDRGELAIVHACGSHDTTRSHFDAQDYMESATPGVKNTRDGWLNRYLNASGSYRFCRCCRFCRFRFYRFREPAEGGGAHAADAAGPARQGAGARDGEHGGV